MRRRSYKLDFDKVFGRGAVDDGHDGVGLSSSKADREAVDLGVRSLGHGDGELDQSAELTESVSDAVCSTDTHTRHDKLPFENRYYLLQC